MSLFDVADDRSDLALREGSGVHIGSGFGVVSSEEKKCFLPLQDALDLFAFQSGGYAGSCMSPSAPLRGVERMDWII